MGICCFLSNANDDLMKEIEAFDETNIIDKTNSIQSKYKNLLESLLLREIPLYRFFELLYKFNNKDIGDKKSERYNFYIHYNTFIQTVNKNQFTEFVDQLLKEVNAEPEKKTTTKNNLLLLYEKVLEFGLVDTTEEEKRKNGICKFLLLPFGFLYCNARKIDKIDYFFNFFKNIGGAKNEYINFISEMNTFFRILFVLVTFGETACIMEDNQIDFCKFIDDNIDDLSDEQKNICNYAKLFCSNSYINDLHSNIKHLHFCSYFNEIGQKREEIQKQIDNGMSKKEYFSLFISSDTKNNKPEEDSKEQKITIPFFYFSSLYIRDYIMKTFKRIVTD